MPKPGFHPQQQQMSGRGGRGGRGRGRGAVPPSVAASSAYNYANNSTSSLGSASSATTAGLVGFRTEPTQKFPDILLPEVPKVEDFSKSAKLAIEYADRLESMLRSSPSFRPIKNDQFKIDRYSDKYSVSAVQSAENREKLSNLETDLSFFPEELHSVYVPGLATGALSKASKVKKHISINEALSHLDEIAMKEQDSANKEDEKGDNDNEDEEVEDENVYEEDEFEDETDYNFSYFDNGEDYGDYDDGNDEAVF